MSTKMTISCDDEHHLYREAFDDSMIYVRIRSCTEMDVKVNHYNGEKERQVTIGIPIEVWQRIVEKWSQSQD